MAYLQGPKMGVKDAVSAVQAFVSDLFGEAALRYATVEEVEYFPDKAGWLVTMGFNTPSNVILGPQKRDLKTFRVDEATGKVLSMRIREDG